MKESYYIKKKLSYNKKLNKYFIKYISNII